MSVFSFFVPPSVPVQVLIDKLYLISKRIVAGVVDVFKAAKS